MDISYYLISRGKYFPIQFPQKYVYYHDNDKDPLDNQIGEFVLEDGQWKLLRIRVDKLKDYQEGRFYGNDYVTANSTWEMIHNPLTFDMLKDTNKMYFANIKREEDRAVTSFNSFVKSIYVKRDG